MRRKKIGWEIEKKRELRTHEKKKMGKTRQGAAWEGKHREHST